MALKRPVSDSWLKSAGPEAEPPIVANLASSDCQAACWLPPWHAWASRAAALRVASSAPVCTDNRHDFLKLVHRAIFYCGSRTNWRCWRYPAAWRRSAARSLCLRAGRLRCSCPTRRIAIVVQHIINHLEGRAQCLSIFRRHCSIAGPVWASTAPSCALASKSLAVLDRMTLRYPDSSREASCMFIS
jgi:hypothetical protein